MKDRMRCIHRLDFAIGINLLHLLQHIFELRIVELIAAKIVEQRLAKRKEAGEKVDDKVSASVIDELIEEILKVYEGTAAGPGQVPLQI